MSGEVFAVETYRVAGRVIKVESIRDGGPTFQRNGSGSYNAKKNTVWRSYLDGEFVAQKHSTSKDSKWMAYEAARQLAERTPDAGPVVHPISRRVTGYTRHSVKVLAEMKEALER